MAAQVELAPEYRYYTVDLLSNEILAEIPFRGVSWERVLKGNGAFTGKIPVIDATKSLNLYETTMPGQTALFVVRNNICVWGGIIWTREHNVVTRDLTVNAAEFTSYFYHRKIWKTWNHQFGATVAIENGEGTVVFDYGSTTPVFSGSSVHIEFYEPSNFKYNGYYRVSSVPAPTLSGFSVVGGQSIADIASVEASGGVATIYTASKHGFNTGDLITVQTDFGSPFNGTFKITAEAGADTNVFTFPVTSGTIARTPVTGTAVRPVPNGIYTKATITVRSDTYDYVRNMIDSVFTDFVGTQFPNVYIEPGISYALDIVEKELAGGLAEITTAEPHGLSVGQAVQIQDVGPNFDGEFEILQTPAPNKLMYAAGGALTPTVVAPLEATITAVALANGVATLTTSAPHGFIVGNHFNVFVGYIYPELNGDQIVDTVPSPTTLTYRVYSTTSIAPKTLPNATATVGGTGRGVLSARISANTATLTLDNDVPFVVGNSVTTANINRVVRVTEKSFDAPNSLATFVTDPDHRFAVGTSVVIEGLSDVSRITRKTSTTTAVTMTTEQGHNYRAGQAVTIGNLLDIYLPTTKSLTSNVATITTPTTHNIPNGASVTISGLVDTYTITSKMISEGVATLGTSIPHNIKVNDQVEIRGIADGGYVVSLQAENNIGILTLSSTHNFTEQQAIIVTGVGAPFDGEHTVLAATSTRVFFEIDNGNAAVLPAKSAGVVVSADSFFNGIFAVSDVSSTSFSFHRGGEDITYQVASGVAEASSVMNGVRAVTGTTSTTVQFTVTGNNLPSETVPIADEDEGEVQASLSLISIHDGARTLTGVTRNTFTFAQAITNAIAPIDIDGAVSAASIFNGTRTITADLSEDTFRTALTGASNVLEEGVENIATATTADIFNGTWTITAVDTVARTISFARVWENIEETPIQSRGAAQVRPTAIVSTFGPYPGNADLQFQYSTRQYSGVNIEPVMYRGFELKTVGEALDAYSDNIDGFEYRVDCSYDRDTNEFIKTFVLIPINFPDPPAPGEISPISRFGADKLVFEYPGGSITGVSLAESAEESSTRFFAVGSTDLGPEAGPNIAVASDLELLSGSNGGRRWPLLDDDQKIDDVDDKTVLYAYAKRYLSENRPPDAKLTVSVNGSIAPLVGTYAPGDWCSLIIDDAFVRMRMQSALEPRDDVIVRKIDGFKVTVPDAVTFPETVSLTLVPEWEVDKRG